MCIYELLCYSNKKYALRAVTKCFAEWAEK